MMFVKTTWLDLRILGFYNDYGEYDNPGEDNADDDAIGVTVNDDDDDVDDDDDDDDDDAQVLLSWGRR